VKIYASLDPHRPLSEVAEHARRVESLGYDGLHVAETVHDALVVAALAAFATGEHPDIVGEYYRLTRLQPYFHPGPAPDVVVPAVWLGGVNERICELAGARAAGLVTHPTNSSPRYLTALCLPSLAAGARSVGRDPAEVGLVVSTPVITGATAEELERQRAHQRRLIAFMYSTPAYRRTLKLYGWGQLTERLQEMVRTDRFEDLERVVTDEMLDALVPEAPYDSLAPLVLARFGSLASGIVLAPPEPGSDEVAFARLVADLHAG